MDLTVSAKHLLSDKGRPLHGIPMRLKENIVTKDKMNNTGNLIPMLPTATGYQGLKYRSGVSCIAWRYCSSGVSSGS